MLKFLKSLFRELSGDDTSDSAETKKCLHCLLRVGLDRLTCPRCGSSNFDY